MVQGEAEAGRLAHVLLDGLRDVARSVGLGKAVASEDCNYTREVRVGIMTDVMLWLIVFAVAQGQCRKTRRKPARMELLKMSGNRYITDIFEPDGRRFRPWRSPLRRGRRCRRPLAAGCTGRRRRIPHGPDCGGLGSPRCGSRCPPSGPLTESEVARLTVAGLSRQNRRPAIQAPALLDDAVEVILAPARLPRERDRRGMENPERAARRGAVDIALVLRDCAARKPPPGGWNRVLGRRL